MSVSDGIARFVARFDSECQGCGTQIAEGDQMGYDKNNAEYICEECIQERSTW